MMLVTHRGPFRFTVRDDGTFESRRGAGGIVSALGPLVLGTGNGDQGDERRSWVAAAISDDDRAAVAAGAAHVAGIDLHLLALDPGRHRLHYDVVSNSVFWFLHHGLFDLPRRPRFDQHFRAAWDGYTAVNRTFADEVITQAAPDEVVLVHDYHFALVPGMVRAERPDLRLAHFTHTPFCGPNSIRVLPDDVAWAICSSMAAAPTGFHTRRWADAFRASTRVVLGPDAEIAPSFVAPLGPDPAALAADAVSPATVEAAETLHALVGERALILRSDRTDPAKNIVRGFLAYDRFLDLHPEWRDRVVFVALAEPLARVARRLPRVRAGGGHHRGAGERAPRHGRVATGGGRHPRRLPAHRRRLHALRRARRELAQGRPQPGGEGGAAREPARRCARALPRSRGVRRAGRLGPVDAPVRPRTGRRGAAPRADHGPGRARRRALRHCAKPRRATRPSRGWPRCSTTRADRRRERGQQFGQPRRAVDHHVLRRRSRRATRRTARRR